MSARRAGTAADGRARRREPLQTLYFQRPRCPRCGGGALGKYRSVGNQGDGTSTAWVRCRDPRCGQRFKIVML